MFFTIHNNTDTNHLAKPRVRHTFSLPRIAKELKIPVVFSFHDFYYVCPTINLLDENGIFCYGTCTPTNGICAVPFTNEVYPELKHAWVKTWQQRVRDFIVPFVDVFITTANSTKEIYLSSYSELKSFVIIEHGRDFLVQQNHAVAPKKDSPIRILIPGYIAKHKGFEFIKKLIELDVNQVFEFHFMGRTVSKLSGNVINHGEYPREKFADIVSQIAPSFIGIFSITAETYSHVLSEAWSVGVPVLVSAYGALGERVTKHGGGWIVDVHNPEATLAEVLRICDDSTVYENQRALACLKNVDSVLEMSSKYMQIYQDLLLG
jgi:glycosyltransferase involved in cell wall biosynthesis